MCWTSLKTKDSSPTNIHTINTRLIHQRILAHFMTILAQSAKLRLTLRIGKLRDMLVREHNIEAFYSLTEVKSLWNGFDTVTTQCSLQNLFLAQRWLQF